MALESFEEPKFYYENKLMNNFLATAIKVKLQVKATLGPKHLANPDLGPFKVEAIRYTAHKIGLRRNSFSPIFSRVIFRVISHEIGSSF